MSIIVSGLTKLYGEQRAVDNISFEVKPGEVLGFLGPNGAGKSTTMKMLTGYVPQTTGKASICGYDVTLQSLEAKKNTGYLPENNPLYPDMYVKEFLLFTGRLNKVKNCLLRAEEMIELTGLKTEQRKKIGALSKGYRQRVGISQALLHNPRVLIMDEPTSGLDPNQLADIRNLIKELGKEKTIIFSTHIMQEVQAICNRVIIISKGKIVADDSIERLQQKSSDEVTITVEFKQRVDKNRLQQISGVKKLTSTSEKKWRLTGRTGLQESIFQFAVANQLTVVALAEEAQSLEDIFKDLTKTN
ncbi:MAG: gliding motility-associated ABC transporter ATP-binding subunit GldA [Chitinophagales bacterium]|jgi:ABC-2 type transport system ATP-binding protein|nr:gliding motility-associated ABC transporter ATP-binding subunit GldA [Chitinophagales bacterium]